MNKHKDECLTAKELSGELGMTYQYFMKVMNYLKRANLVKTVQGCNGGFLLAEQSEELTLYDMVRIMEGDIIINRCLEEDGFCSRNGTATCQVHKELSKLQAQIRDSLEKVYIKDLTM